MSEPRDSTSVSIDLKASVFRSVPSPFHHMINTIRPKGGPATSTVYLTESSEHPLYVDYFTQGDKANKVLCVEAVRWLRDIPEINRLTVVIRMSDEDRQVRLNREEVERFIGISFPRMAAMPEEWEGFLRKFDHRVGRALFVKRFQSARPIKFPSSSPIPH